MAQTMTMKSKIIGFRVCTERDEDILAWWETIPAGERSQVLRTLIRAFVHGEISPTPPGEQPTSHSRSIQLSHVQADTRWIRDALLDMPGYLEDLFDELRQTLVTSRRVPTAQPAQPATDDDDEIAPDHQQRRTGNLLERDW